ncbi:MAG: HEAT repeat domain-containing protein [Chloroflexi bacterium]|nr:HEAT repeat domain-containing protein [Chloroflexota bacterium]
MTEELGRVLLSLVDEGRPLRPSMLYALSGLGPDQLAEVQTAWKRASTDRTRAVLRALVELTEIMIDADFTALFRWWLGDEDAEVRLLAIEGLWEDEDVGLVGSLLRLLKDDDQPAVRAAAAASLGRFVLLGELGQINAAVGARAEQALLEAYFTFEEALEVRRRALEAVAYSSEAGVSDLIDDAYHEGEEEMCLSALLAMGRSADRRWRPLLIQELDNPSPAMRYEAAQACGELELRDAVPALARLIDVEDVEVRDMAIEALGKIGGAGARRILGECWVRGDDVLQAVVEEALLQASWLGDEELEVLDDWSLAEPW